MKQDEDVWQYQDDVAVALEYWKDRCLAAEKFIEESPCDYITIEREKAHNNWQQIKNKKHE